MKKLVIIAALGAVVMLMLASASFAMQAPYTHGDFATNSKGCGDCHITHSADVAKLLRAGSGGLATQTAFCLGCHGKLSPFDVKYGVVMKETAEDTSKDILSERFTWGGGHNSSNSNMSLAGGFNTSGDFKLTAQAYSLIPSTSVHNVRGVGDAAGSIAGVTTYDYVYGNTIPGGTGTLDFECGSCHDPHLGGMYPDPGDPTKNPRLLKKNILGRTNMQVVMEFNQPENLPTKYTNGINNWCGSCHDIFDTSALGASASPANELTTRTGYYKLGGRTKYMHLFGIDVHDTTKHGFTTDPFTVEWLALENNASSEQKEIMCLTCHRAHGSSAPWSNNWSRYTSYVDYDGSGTTATGQGSALLRLPERDVCYGCHGAAQYNHSDTHALSPTE